MNSVWNSLFQLFVLLIALTFHNQYLNQYMIKQYD